MKIYGVDNVSKSKVIKDKKIITCNKNYSVNNPQQSNLIKEKTKNTKFEKYGTLNIINKNNGKESNPHTKVLEYLKSLNYECESEYTIPCKDCNGKVIRTPRVDIYIPKLNLCVEVYGNWCHANPRLYEKEDTFVLWDSKHYHRDLMAIEIWTKDEIRLNLIKEQGYNVSVIWEMDINNDDFSSLTSDLEYLENKLKENNLPKGYGQKSINCIYENNKLCYGFDEELNFYCDLT